MVLALHNQTRIGKGESYAKERGVVCSDRRCCRGSSSDGAGSFSPLGAQNESDANFGKITCEELEVVSVIGRVNISNAMILVKNDLPGDVLRGTILEGTPGTTLITGGRVDVTGEDDMAQVQICTDERGGLISVHGKRGSEAQVMIDVKDHGGVLPRWAMDNRG